MEIEFTPEPTPGGACRAAGGADADGRTPSRRLWERLAARRDCSRTSIPTTSCPGQHPRWDRPAVAAAPTARSRALRSRSAPARLPAPRQRSNRRRHRPAARPPSPAATACVQVLRRPRSRAWRTVPRSSAARRSPETSSSRATISATIQPGKTPSPTSRIITVRTRSLSATGSRSEPSADVRPLRRARRPSNQSVAMATANTAVAQ